MEGTSSEGGVVERVTKELEEKSKRVEELEGLLGAEREERRVLEERIRLMEDERAALLQRQLELEETHKDVKNNDVEEDEAETLKDEQPPQQQMSPTPLIVIPDVIADIQPSQPTMESESRITPPASPSTAPSSPLQGEPSTRSISPISLPSTESSHNPDPTPFLEKISLLESQLQLAQSQIASLKTQLSGTSPVLGAVSTSLEFPFTFSAPSPGNSPLGRNARNATGSTRRKRSERTMVVGGDVLVSGGGAIDEEGNKELFEGLVAAVGIVVIGWMGTWFVNQLFERSHKT